MKKIYNWFRNLLIRLWGVIKYMMKENTIAKVEAIDATKENIENPSELSKYITLAAGKGVVKIFSSKNNRVVIGIVTVGFGVSLIASGYIKLPE